MNNQEFPFNITQNGAAKDSPGVDYKRILYRAFQFWYLIALSLFVALFIAFLKNRYSPRIYPVTASILIKERGETAGGGELLYRNALIDARPNYLNELYIIRSYPLIESVIEELNFGVSFYQEGNILTSEIYPDVPVTVNIINKDEVTSRSGLFTMLNDRQYRIAPVSDQVNAASASRTFNFNDTIVYDGLECVFTIKPGATFDPDHNKPLIFSYTSPGLLAGSYAGKLSASWAEKGSGVVNLSVTGINPKKETDFLYGLIRRYQRYNLDKKNQTASRTIEFISGQLNEMSDSLQHVENMLERFKEKNVITDLEGEASRLFEKLEDVESQKTEMIIRSNYNQYLINYIKKDQNLDHIILPSSVGLNDNILGALLKDMVDIQSEIKQIIGRDNLDNPLVRNRRQRLEEIKNSIIESVRNQQNVDKIRADQINKHISDIEKQLNYLPAAERQFISISRNYSLLENLYIFLLQKRAEAGISKASSATDIEVVNLPMVGGAISPKPAQNFVIAGILGLAIPLSIFVLLEYINTRVQSKEDVEKLTTIPFIGGLGHKKSADNRAVMLAPKSRIAESFRALRSNLAYFTKDKQSLVILISSSISGEGKTFTTVNLATVMAFSGKKTLIVGADMRRPKLYSDFNLSNSIGLSSYLAHMNTFDEVVQKTDIENLDLISGGPMPPNPAELILRPVMEQFFSEARKRYDCIIVDSPPLGIVSDAFVLTQYSDHLLFLTRQNFTPKNMLKSIDEFYKNGRLQNVSLVLNDIYKSGPGYGYGYGYAYGYNYNYGYATKNNGHEYYTE